MYSVCFFYSKTFFSVFYRFRNAYKRKEIHSLENCHVKILVLESKSENGKNIYGSESEKMNSDPEHWYRHYYAYCKFSKSDKSCKNA
jgi:hypothetical protein